MISKYSIKNTKIFRLLCTYYYNYRCKQRIKKEYQIAARKLANAIDKELFDYYSKGGKDDCKH